MHADLAGKAPDQIDRVIAPRHRPGHRRSWPLPPFRIRPTIRSYPVRALQGTGFERALHRRARLHPDRQNHQVDISYPPRPRSPCESRSALKMDAASARHSERRGVSSIASMLVTITAAIAMRRGQTAIPFQFDRFGIRLGSSLSPSILYAANLGIVHLHPHACCRCVFGVGGLLKPEYSIHGHINV